MRNNHKKCPGYHYVMTNEKCTLHEFVIEPLEPTGLIFHFLTLCFIFTIHYTYALVHIHTFFIVSVLVANGNKAKSWPGSFQSCDDTMIYSSLMVNWQNGSISQGVRSVLDDKPKPQLVANKEIQPIFPQILQKSGVFCMDFELFPLTKANLTDWFQWKTAVQGEGSVCDLLVKQ